MNQNSLPKPKIKFITKNNKKEYKIKTIKNNELYSNKEKN